MAKFKFDERAFKSYITQSSDVDNAMRSVANDVANKARSTASDAENGSGGTISGYASAGFSVEVKKGTKRNEYRVVSNADPKISLAAHFNSQRKNGVGHLRAALYAFAASRNFKTYPKGKPYRRG
jgi:hypothetical protein